MNKRRVENLIPMAIEALNNNTTIKKIDKDTKAEYIDKKFRSKISAFGAAVTMGSFKSAVAFFSAQNNSDVEREELLRIMYYLYKKEEKSAKEVLKAVASANDSELREMKDFFIDASIAVKLALNAFDLK